MFYVCIMIAIREKLIVIKQKIIIKKPKHNDTKRHQNAQKDSTIKKKKKGTMDLPNN